MLHARTMVGVRGVLWGIAYTIILLIGATHSHASSLLSRQPKIYPVFKGFPGKASNCRNLLQPTLDHIAKLQNQGHKVAIIMNNGSAIPLPKNRIRDEFQGTVYNNINDYVDAVEDFVSGKLRGTRYKSVEEVVKRCLRGMPSKIIPEACAVRTNVRYLHTGFIVMDRAYAREPYVVHFYGDENYNYLKASIRVESLDSYLDESKMGLCESKIVLPTAGAQKKILNFLAGDHSQRLLAKGDRTFNLAADPWGLKSQNCNIWASEVLATALFSKSSGWARSTRPFAKEILAKTGFVPVKFVLTPLLALGRLPAMFVGGVDMEEGNFIHHPYTVGDIVPTESIDEWLALNGFISSRKIIRGNQ